MAARGWYPVFLAPNEASARCLAVSVRGGGGGGCDGRGSFWALLAPPRDWLLRMFSKARAAFFFASGSAAAPCLAVGGTPFENRVCHRCAPDVAFRAAVLRRGGVGNCWLTFAHGLPLTPEAPTLFVRLSVASYLAFC